MTLKEIKESLNEDQLLWLNEVYKRTKGLEKVNKNELIRDLHQHISETFSINSLHPTFFVDSDRNTRDSQLTLFGVYVCDQESKIIKNLDSVIKAIKDVLLNDPSNTEFEAEYFADKLSLEYDYVTKILGYLRDLTSLTSGSSGTIDSYTFDMVKTDNSYTLFNLFRYNGIDNEILNHLTEQLQNKKNPKKLFYEPAKYDDKNLERDSIIPNTAFIIMQMNEDTTDTKNAIIDVCEEFGIVAKRADDIEHSGIITKTILEQIKKSEFLIADLTGARPNVYYEVGYAHAQNKKPILYRRLGSDLHFDLKVHNVPEYKNNTHLKDLLHKRFKAILGRESNTE
ncbi:hypothetical protein [Gracilimonas sp.]|uniref:hypothetical protein n=1 Tax=Gracilimonas sp. TaxID=1974203 RepID=UPI003BAA80F0